MDNDVIHRRLQITQLEILKYFKDICDKNHISYFLDSGTLIGAVRHQGFIPWDDDIDVGMERIEYERFISIWIKYFKGTQSKYYLECKEIDPSVAMPFSKLRKRGTILIEKETQYEKEKPGISIDIFPFDDVPDKDRLIFKIKLKISKFFISVSRYKRGYRGFSSKWGKLLCWLFQWIPYRFINFFQHKTYTHYNNKGYNNMACYIFSRGHRSCVGDKEKVFGKGASIVFEGELFSCPVDYDTYLRTQYGNYMELPPVEKRGIRHRILEVDFGNE